MSHIILKRTFLIAYFLLVITQLTTAQRGTVSPYSRYGIGELQFTGFVPQIGMGGTGITLHNQDRLNTLNAASYAFDTITTFEAGLKSEVTKLSTTAASQTTNGASLSYLAFGFPVIKNKWGASFGVIPYTAVGYTIIDEQTDPDRGRVDYKFTGDGGLNRFYLGNGFAPFSKAVANFRASAKYRQLVTNRDTTEIRKTEKRLNAIKGISIGVNASWLFGTLNNTRSVEFLESANTNNTRIINKTTFGDIDFNFGLLYALNLKNDYTFDLGLIAGLNSKINSTYNSLWYNYTSTSGFETAKDTVSITTDLKGQTQLPFSYGAGVGIGKKDKWRIAFDFSTQNWSDYKSFTATDSLSNSFSTALGAEWIPNKNGFNYSNKIQYRFGARYSKSSLTLRNNDIKDMAVTLGFGLPIINKDRIQKATIQIGFEAGQRGTTENNLLKQQYLRFHIGVTMNETWFFKRKYD